MSEKQSAILNESVMNQIYLIREQKVMLDKNLAALYGVETRTLKQAVRRNIDRFPIDFMFELTNEELDILVSQFVIPDKKAFGGAKSFAFTEQGVAMLATVLNSKQAIQVNIQIMRIFTKVRQMLADQTTVKLEIAEIKEAIHKIANRQDGHGKNIDLLFQYIDRLQEEAEDPKPPEMTSIGYKIGAPRLD